MQLSQVEKKALGALLLMANDDMIVKATKLEIAEKMGYKTVGGSLTYALQLLDMKNFIAVERKGEYKVLL